MSTSPSKVAVERADGVTRVWIDRPDVHNAFDDEVIRELAGHAVAGR